MPGNEYHDEWNKRLSFALKLFAYMPNEVRLAMMTYAVSYSAEMGPGLLRSFVTPLFGTGPAPYVPTAGSGMARVYTTGDMEAKLEAAKMLTAAPTPGSLPSPQVQESTEKEEALV